MEIKKRTSFVWIFLYSLPSVVLTTPSARFLRVSADQQPALPNRLLPYCPIGDGSGGRTWL
jgi:hypothetical protein